MMVFDLTLQRWWQVSTAASNVRVLSLAALALKGPADMPETFSSVRNREQVQADHVLRSSAVRVR